MKKQLSRVVLMAGIVACSLFSVSAFAQAGRHTPEEKAKRMADSLKMNLALTDSQYTKVYDLNVNYATKMQALRQQSGSKEEKMQSFRKLRKSQNQDLSAILTKEQMEKYKVMQKERRQEKKEHHGTKQHHES